MAQVKDPVCGMMIEQSTAAAQSTYNGTAHYFCSTACKKKFDKHPERYVTPAAGSMESEPRFTKTGPLVAPKFGSAGSGGAEYEMGPTQRKR